MPTRATARRNRRTPTNRRSKKVAKLKSKLAVTTRKKARARRAKVAVAVASLRRLTLTNRSTFRASICWLARLWKLKNIPMPTLFTLKRLIWER